MRRSKRTITSSRPGPRPPKRQTVAELRSLQRLMGTAVMRPLSPGGRMNPRWTDGTSTRRLVAGFITPNARLSALERLQLYNRQYWFRVLDCFREDFPGLRAVLGERKFSRLAERYLAAHPSRSFTMRNLGSEIVRFIETHPELVSPRQAVALDMARLEWAHIDAFDNAAEPVLTAEDLMGADPGKLRLRLQPYLTLLHIDHALDGLLVDVRRSKDLRRAASNAATGKRRGKTGETPLRIRVASLHLAVHRFNNSVYYKRLRPVEFAVLGALRQGLTLKQAVIDTTEKSAGRAMPPERLTECFRSWSALGWFCRGTPLPPPPPLSGKNQGCGR